MDTPTAVRLSRQAHALNLLQDQLHSLQTENTNLRTLLLARETELTALQTVISSMRLALEVGTTEGDINNPDTHD